MQDSLLSRFDCLFVLLDEHDNVRDTAIAEHIIKLHRYRASGEAEGQVHWWLMRHMNCCLFRCSIWTLVWTSTVQRSLISRKRRCWQPHSVCF